MTAKKRMQAMRDRRKASGLKKMELWAHPSDHAPIKQHAKLLDEIRRQMGVLNQQTKE